MKLLELKEVLSQVDQVRFKLPDGNYVPEHFHVTEVGKINKHFVDCGGTVRNETVINFQLWTANDYDHRLSAEKLRSIIDLSEKHLDLGNYDIEVEFQAETIGKYSLEFQGPDLLLIATQTDCLAKDKCGIPESKPKVKLSVLTNQQSNCSPESGCC